MTSRRAQLLRYLTGTLSLGAAILLFLSAIHIFYSVMTYGVGLYATDDRAPIRAMLALFAAGILFFLHGFGCLFRPMLARTLTIVIPLFLIGHNCTGNPTIVSNQVLLVFGGPYAAFLLWLFTNHDAARPTSWGRAPRTLGFLYLSLLISLALVGSIMKSAPVQKGRLVDSQVKLDHIYSKALWDDSNNWSNLRSLEPLDRPGGAWYQFSLPQNDVEVSGFIPRRSGTIYLDDSQILFLLEYAMHKVPRAEEYFYQEALEEQQMLNDMLRKTFLKKSLIVSLPLFLSTMIILRQGERKGGRS